MEAEKSRRSRQRSPPVKVPTATLDDDFLTPNFLEDMPVALQSLA